jgi:hypothetical protein
MMDNHIMLDLETLGTNVNAPIMSIGAVRFNPYRIQDVEALPKLHFAINLEETMLGKPDGGTILWWMHPDRRPALDEWLAMPKIDIHSALYEFNRWVGFEPFYIWGNGATFDDVVLSQTYLMAGIPKPWTYRDELDMRTVTYLSGKKEWPKRESIVHSALADAKYQVECLQRMLKFF